jgi:hypothetical protein
VDWKTKVVTGTKAEETLALFLYSSLLGIPPILLEFVFGFSVPRIAGITLLYNGLKYSVSWLGCLRFLRIKAHAVCSEISNVSLRLSVAEGLAQAIFSTSVFSASAILVGVEIDRVARIAVWYTASPFFFGRMFPVTLILVQELKSWLKSQGWQVRF